MGQEFARRLLVADEVVVDKIDRGLDAGGEQRVELGEDLLRRFKAGLTPVKRRDVAELAAIGASARKLDAADEIAAAVDPLIGRDRELGERQTLSRGKTLLRCGWPCILIDRPDQLVRCIAELAEVEIIEFGILLRRSGDR